MKNSDFVYQAVETPLGTLLARCENAETFKLSTFNRFGNALDKHYPTVDQMSQVATSITAQGIDLKVETTVTRSHGRDFTVRGTVTHATSSPEPMAVARAQQEVTDILANALPDIAAQLTNALAQADANTFTTKIQETEARIAQLHRDLDEARAELDTLRGKQAAALRHARD